MQSGAIELDFSHGDELSSYRCIDVGEVAGVAAGLNIFVKGGSGTGVVTGLELEAETVADENESAKAGIVSSNPRRNDNEGYGRNHDGTPDARRSFFLALRPNPACGPAEEQQDNDRIGEDQNTPQGPGYENWWLALAAA